MSPSNSRAVVIPVRNIDESPLSDKGKGVAEEAPAGSPTLSDDECSAAFARMTSADRDKLKQELFKCFLEPYIKGLRGASSGHVGYMSQLAAEVNFSFSWTLGFYSLIYFSNFATVLTYFFCLSFDSSLLAALLLKTGRGC